MIQAYAAMKPKGELRPFDYDPAPRPPAAVEGHARPAELDKAHACSSGR